MSPGEKMCPKCGDIYRPEYWDECPNCRYADAIARAREELQAVMDGMGDDP